MREVLEGKRINLGDKPYWNQKGFYEANMVPLLNNKNEITGGLSIFHDITQRKITEEKTRERENLLKESQEIDHLGSWEWMVRKNKITWSDQMFKIFGYLSQEVEVTPDFFFSHLAEGDSEKVKDIINESFKSISSSFSFEIKIVRKDNCSRVLLVKGKALAYNNFIPFKMMGIAWDITDRKKSRRIIKCEKYLVRRKKEELIRIELELTKNNSELEKRVNERTQQLSEINIELSNEILERKKISTALEQRNHELIKLMKTWIILSIRHRMI